MKIFAKEQIYEGDRLTAERQGISSTDLMERAGTQIFNWLHSRMQGAPVPIHVFCGIGNNGGDGLVISRHLITHGYNVITYVVNCSDKRSKDFLVNYDRIKTVTKDWPILLSCEEDFPKIKKEDIIVDAVFGIGLNRKPDDWVQGLFLHFRNSRAFTLSVDIPSGLFADKVPEDENAVVWANHTLSFASPKLAFFLPDTAKYTQQWEVLDIGLDPEFLFTTETMAELIGKYEVLPMYRPRNKFSHKGDYGHSLLVGGSFGKMGAMILCAKAALTVGSGLVTVNIPKSGNVILQTAVPEAMTHCSSNEESLDDIFYSDQFNALGIGPGMGTQEVTKKAFDKFLGRLDTPIVLDADALNILADNKKLLKKLPPLSILTPHPGELKRLIGDWKDDFDKLAKAMKFSKDHQCIILIKGAHTLVVFQEKVFINSTGNPGMATAGSGDVLTGMITGLMAQGYEPIPSTIFGAYLHGLAGDFAARQFGYESLTASLIIDFIDEAILDLFQRPEPLAQPEEEEEKD